MGSEPEYLPPLHDVDTPPETDRRGPAAGELAVPSTRFRDISTLEPGERLYTNFQDAGAFHYASKASSTRRAYSSDWKHFSAWCESHNLRSLPAQPGTVVLYIAELARPTDGSAPRKPATIGRRLTAINTFHKDAQLDSPALMSHRALSATYQGIRRELGTAQTMKKPITRERVVKILANLEGPLQAARNKALVLVGFAGALRRSELVGIRGRTCERTQQRRDDHHPEVQDRSGVSGSDRGDSVGSPGRHLSRAGAPKLAVRYRD